MQLNIVCPKCATQTAFSVSGQGEFSLTCKNCNIEFTSLVGTARSKRSRGQRKTNTREYDVRYTQNGTEKYLQFSSDTYSDAELKSKDQFVLSSIGGKPRILQNLTIGQYWRINAAPLNPWLVLIIIAILIVVALLIF